MVKISHFSSTVCSDTMAKRSQQDSGEERVTAKSKPMMNLIARTPSIVSSSTSISPGKRYYGSQDPWKSVAGEDRRGQPGKGTESDSGASAHMISKKDLNDAEMDTLTKSCSPTIVITANGEVQTHEEAAVYVKELEKILDNESPRRYARSIVAWKALR